MVASTETGLYRQAGTLLHRADPRLKIFSCLLLVVLSFSASAWMQLLPLFSILAIAAWSVRPFSRQILRVFRMLRWLLLFSLLMHLFFSPGRTLWGLSWLSFDGLLTGTFVCLQILLAVTVSALLGITTSTASLSLAFGWLVQPLALLGCRTDAWQKIMAQAIDFIPLVHAEISASAKAEEATSDKYSPVIKQDRLHAWGKSLHNLIFRLIDRGDEIAYRLAADDESVLEQQCLQAFLPMTFLDQLIVVIVFLVTLSYGLMG